MSEEEVIIIDEPLERRKRSRTSPVDEDDEPEEDDSGLGQDKSESEDDNERDTRERSESPIPEGQYEVEKILDFVRDVVGDLYLVKWKGWDESANTWEPPSSLANCHEVLYNFYLQRKEEIAKIMEQSVYEMVNGRKRRKGPPLKVQLPPDPRPLEVRAEALYRRSGYPKNEDREACQLLWKKSLLRKTKESQRWSMTRIDKTLRLAISGELSADDEMVLRNQILLRELDEKRELAVISLQEWEAHLNSISESKPLIKVENAVDWEGPPTNFTYINDYYSPGINIPNDPPLGCTCKDCFDERNNCCAAQFSAKFAYSQYKRLRVPVGTPIYECNNACKCGPECPNRVVQDGRTSLTELRLCIFRTSNGCGWGIKTLKAIKKGTFVSLYVGEVIGTEEAERRGREYDAEGCTYLFDLDFNEGDTCPYTVDAAKYGNITHFINHSCDPNLAVFPVWVNCLDPNLPKLALFAMQDISRGEELSFDYKNQNGGSESEDMESDKPVTERKTCLCGSANCRKFLF